MVCRERGPSQNEVMEGSRDGNLIGGYGVGAHGRVNKLVSDDG